MSREIKFRAWSKKRKSYRELDQLVFDNQGLEEIWVFPKDNETQQVYNPSEMIIEQFTGLKDKNGKEIYEGDIVKFGCGDQTPAEVVYQDGSYFIKALDDGTLFYDPDANKPCPFGWFETYGLEVIGNIHENPELLGDKE